MIKDLFFGRKLYLDILEKRIGDLSDGYRQNIAIVGDESAGKTSIILKFLDKFYNNRIIIVYLEIRPESLISFTKRFIGSLLYNFLTPSGIPLNEDLSFLLKKSSKFIPQTIEKIKLILNASIKRKKASIFTELLSLTELINQETSKVCVVIFDEFHNLENMGIKNLYREWSKVLLVQKNTMYIILSSAKFKTKAILSKDLSLLFGNFQLITIEPFDIKTSEGYLESRFSECPLDKGLNNFIVYFTGGWPLYLKIIADTLLKNNQWDLSDIVENLLFDSSGILNQRFSNYIKRLLDSKRVRDDLSILYLISCGRNKLKEIAHILHKQKKEVVDDINYLLEIDTITRSADFLKINDRLFAFWLRFVYHERINSLTPDAKNQREAFRNNIENMTKEFLVTTHRPLPERMTEILRLFEDDSVQIERKRIRLQHFKEIRPLEFTARSLKDGLICRSSDSLWLVAFKYDLLTEEDIAGFARECKKYRHKLQRKIIISLNDIDSNARLRALEEKILTWDINSLNQIFDLFSKPGIIV